MKGTAAALAAAAAPTPGTVWAILGCIAAAGAVGGLVNALTGGSGGTGLLITPQVVQPQGVFQLGFIGNIVLGAFGAVLTWGAVRTAQRLGHDRHAARWRTARQLDRDRARRRRADRAAGAKVITSELDKYVAKKTAVTAAAGAGDPNLAIQIASSHPIAALAAAMPPAPAATDAGGGADSPPATAAAATAAAAPQSVP